MHPVRFDSLVRTVSRAASRRSVLAGLASGLLMARVGDATWVVRESGRGRWHAYYNVFTKEGRLRRQPNTG